MPQQTNLDDFYGVDDPDGTANGTGLSKISEIDVSENDSTDNLFVDARENSAPIGSPTPEPTFICSNSRANFIPDASTYPGPNTSANSSSTRIYEW